MATYYKNTKMQRKDDNGNVEIHYPITKKENVSGLGSTNVSSLCNDMSDIRHCLKNLRKTDEWHDATGAITKRWNHTEISVGNKIYIIGGGNSPTNIKIDPTIYFTEQPIVPSATWVDDLPDERVTFNGNGGVGSMPAVRLHEGATYILPNATFTRTNHTVIGWKVGNIGDILMPGASIVVTTKIMLYAQWVMTTSTTRYIGFITNGGTGTVPPITVTSGTNYTLPGTTFVRTGYTFSGWKIDNTGNTLAAGTVITVTAHIALYAQWVAATPPNYIVSFEANGGAGMMISRPVTANSKYALPTSKFTRSDHIFSGWQIGGQSGISAAGSSITISTDIVLIAQWTKGSGSSENPYSTSVEIYDTLTNTVQVGGAIPADAYGFTSGVTACCVGEKIYCVGHQWMNIYDITTNSWEKTKLRPGDDTFWNAHDGAIHLNGKIYITQGNCNRTYMDIYDIATQTWSKSSNMPSARIHAGICHTHNKIYIVGGNGGSSSDYRTSTLYIYDIESNTWSKGADLLLPIWTLESALVSPVINDMIYVFANIPGWDYPLVIDEYDIVTNTWTRKNASTTGWYLRRGYTWIVVDDDRPWIVDATGKVLRYGTVSDVLQCDFDGSTASGNFDYGKPNVIDGRVYVCAGWDLRNVQFCSLGQFDIDNTLTWLGHSLSTKYNRGNPPSINGTYIGNGNLSTGQEIFLGFRPSSVMICQTSEFVASTAPFIGTILIGSKKSYCKTTSGGASLLVGEITNDGFIVYANGSMTNLSGATYYYTAFK